MEKILTGMVGETEIGSFFQLVVLDDQGKTIWRGPKKLDTDNPLMFGSWDFGATFPEIVGDIDGDGQTELVAPVPRSDVSPSWFRVLRWTGTEFKPVRSMPLLEEPPGSNQYPWRKTERYMGRWIDSFVEFADDGKITAIIGEYPEGGEYRTGKAALARTADGFKLIRWLKPLGPFEPEGDIPETQAPGSKTPDTAGSGGGFVARYTCQIGDEDLRNSAGGRLGKVGEILAQDRANYHRFKIRHRRDLDGDNYFSSPARRELFRQLPVRVPQGLADAIVRGGATVRVTVFPDRIEVSQPE
jgi:hypothetical protein